MSVNIFTKQKWFRLTCTSITSRKLHLKSSRSSNSLQKPHTILKRATVAIRSTLRQHASIQQTEQILHTKWLSCTAIHCEHCLRFWKTHLGGQTYTKTENYQGFFGLKPREIPILSRFRRPIKGLSKKTGWWWWPLTSYCDVKKRISAVSATRPPDNLYLEAIFVSLQVIFHLILPSIIRTMFVNTWYLKQPCKRTCIVHRSWTSPCCSPLLYFSNYVMFRLMR